MDQKAVILILFQYFFQAKIVGKMANILRFQLLKPDDWGLSNINVFVFFRTFGPTNNLTLGSVVF